jgi:hypothetical protein
LEIKYENITDQLYLSDAKLPALATDSDEMLPVKTLTLQVTKTFKNYMRRTLARWHLFALSLVII